MDTLTPTEMKRKYYTVYLIVLLAGLDCSVGAPTTRPLEHSPSDLAWDAWVKNGHRQEAAIPPRRITTKSLFVFPNLGADSLPACAEGYRPDAMGRCVKVVKVNESAHLEFLLQKLNSQFATDSGSASGEDYDYDIETDTADGTGPFQVNIPLALSNAGNKNDENEPGEYVVISKKDPPQHISHHQHHKMPTSSPEVVPPLPNDNSQFFHGGPPAETQDVLSPNNSSSTGGVSIHLRNSTNIGLTLLIPSNGKIESASESNNVDKEEENSKEKTDENDPEASVENEETFITVSRNDQESGTKAENNSEENTHKRNTSPTSTERIMDMEFSVNKEKDKLMEQIESLKINPMSKPQQHHHSAEHLYANSNINFQKKNPQASNEDIDIEEKIKIISKFADVSRNTEDLKDTAVHPNKNPSSNYIRFPTSTEQRVDYNYGKPLDLLPVPSMPIELPINSHGMPIPQNSVYNVHPINNYEKFQPLYYDKNYNSEEKKFKPQWLPFGWNIHGNPSGEQNLIDFWSRLSMMQRYPYRFHTEQRPTQYPSLYPSSRESGGRLNVRHTAVNYRQGREDALTRHVLYPDDSMTYKRSLHPHFRDTTHTVQAYNGR